MSPTVIPDDGADPPALDRGELLQRCGGDERLAAELLQLFATHALSDAARLGEIERADERALIAHRLKGAALAIGAREMAEAAGRVEAGAPAEAIDAPLARLRAALEGSDPG